MNRQINEEAAHWFVEFRTGDIDAAGRRNFDTWVRTSPEHLRAFIEIAALWGHSGKLGRHSPFSLEELIASARKETNVVPLSRMAPPEDALTGRQRRFRLAAAAAALLVIGSIVAGSLLSQRRTFSAEVGERRSLRLADGSRVTLNSRSRVRIELNDSTRTVDLLEGEALFRVAPEVSRPFVVRAKGTFIRAIGTEFDVDEQDRGAVIAVVDGRVAVSRADARTGSDRNEAQPDDRNGVLVSAGERIDMAEGSSAKPTPINASSATAWTQGKVILQSATLEEVVERFNRYSQRRLVAADQGAVPFRLSGVFSTDTDFLIRYLRERGDIEVQESATQIRIVRTGNQAKP
jgi:transmembrane sensor